MQRDKKLLWLVQRGGNRLTQKKTTKEEKKKGDGPGKGRKGGDRDKRGVCPAGEWEV